MLKKGYIIDVDAFGVPAIETLSSDSCEIAAINIFSVQSVYMTGVSRDMLFLELVGGTSKPGDAVLDVVEVWHLFCGVHCSYICTIIIEGSGAKYGLIK